MHVSLVGEAVSMGELPCSDLMTGIEGEVALFGEEEVTSLSSNTLNAGTLKQRYGDFGYGQNIMDNNRMLFGGI